MVGPINSNRPVQIPQVSAPDDTEPAPRGKSRLSVGHQAKAMLGDMKSMDGMNYSAPNAMGKLASMIAKMELAEEQVPDAPPEPEVIIVEAAVTTIVVDAPAEETAAEVMLDVSDEADNFIEEPEVAEIILDVGEEQTAAEVILEAIDEAESVAEEPVIADIIPDAEEEET